MLMNRRPRDSQRQRLYNWERTLERTVHGKPQSQPVELAEAQSICNMVCNHFKIRRRRWPTVTDGRARKRAAYNIADNKVKLPRWCRDQWMTLHEMSHFLVCFRWGLDRAPHGREFVSIYMYLLEKFAGVDRKLMARLANDFGLAFDHIDTYRKVRGKSWHRNQ